MDLELWNSCLQCCNSGALPLNLPGVPVVLGRMDIICAVLGTDGFGGQGPAVLALKRLGKNKKGKKGRKNRKGIKKKK